MYYCCKSCSSFFIFLLKGICKLNCFRTPFSCCAFLSFFVTIIPFCFAIASINQENSFKNCDDPPIALHLTIQGICNLINFIFCCYLAHKYSVHNEEKNEENSMFNQTVKLLCLDVFFCLYVFFIIFVIVWTVFGFIWLENLDSNSLCHKFNESLIQMDFATNIVMIVFLFSGFISLCCFGWVAILSSANDLCSAHFKFLFKTLSCDCCKNEEREEFIN